MAVGRCKRGHPGTVPRALLYRDGINTSQLGPRTCQRAPAPPPTHERNLPPPRTPPFPNPGSKLHPSTWIQHPPITAPLHIYIPFLCTFFYLVFFSCFYYFVTFLPLHSLLFPRHLLCFSSQSFFPVSIIFFYILSSSPPPPPPVSLFSSSLSIFF